MFVWLPEAICILVSWRFHQISHLMFRKELFTTAGYIFYSNSFPHVFFHLHFPKSIIMSPKLFPEFGHLDIFLQVTVIFHQTHVRQIHIILYQHFFPQLIWFHQIYTRFIMIYILNKTHTQPLTTAIHQLLVNSLTIFPRNFPHKMATFRPLFKRFPREFPTFARQGQRCRALQDLHSVLAGKEDGNAVVKFYIYVI